MTWAALTLSALLLVLAIAPATQAMPVTVTYSIGTGTFNGPNSTGAVTSGNLVITWPNAVSLYSASLGPFTLTSLTLTGPSGYFKVLGPAQFVGGLGGGGAIASGDDGAVCNHVNIGCAQFSIVTGGATVAPYAGYPASFIWFAYGPPNAPRTGPTVAASFGPFLFVPTAYNYTVSGGSVVGPKHFFALGQEVSRTSVAEPNTGSLLFLAIASLAFAGAARRRR